MFLELVKNPPWKAWAIAPAGKAPALPMFPAEIRATAIERARMASAGRVVNSECEARAIDTRTVDEVLAAEPEKDDDGDPVADIHALSLAGRPPADALSLLARGPVARMCARCFDFAPLLLLQIGPPAIPEIVRIVRDPSNRFDEIDLLDVFASTATPLIIPELLDRLTTTSDELRKDASRHLDRFAADLAPSLVALAAGADPAPLGWVAKEEERDEHDPPMAFAMRARFALSILARMGREDLVLAAAKDLGLEKSAKEWAAMPPIVAGRDPWSAPRMPKRVVLEGKKLDPEGSKALVGILSRIDWHFGRRDAETLRSELDEPSRKAVGDAFARAFVRDRSFSDRWIAKVAVAVAPERIEVIRSVMTPKRQSRSMRQRWKEQLAVHAMSDAAVFHPDLREKMLAALGSMALDPVKGRRHMNHTANEALVEVAGQLGLDPMTLDDRTIPSLGLDARTGGTMLDWGGRPLEVRMTPALELVFVSEGEKRPSPPAPRKGDDKRKVAKAKKEVERLRKEARVLALGLTGRIERWMRDGQRWDPDEFVRHVVGHPILRAIAQGFVWGSFDGPFASNVVRTFRIAEDGTFADENDAEVHMAGRIGMVHPGEIDAALRQRWGGVLADYEILQLLPQLELRTPSDAQRTSDTLEHPSPPDNYYASRVRLPGWTEASHWNVNNARAVWEREIGRFRITMVYLDTPRLFAHVRPLDSWRRDWSKWGEVDAYVAHEALVDLDVFAEHIAKARRR